jgi:hypothetical protein
MRYTVAISALVAAGALVIPAASFADPGPPQSAHISSASKAAPADNYFGRFGQSVLEIRNRLDRMQSEPDATLRSAGGIDSIEYVDDAVAAWKGQYPHDPWLAGTLMHLFECYIRSGQAHVAHATALLESLVANFPNSKEADEALRTFARADSAAGPGTSPAQPVTTVVAGRILDATTSAPVAGALVLVSDGTSNDPASTPFATSGTDGTFRVSGVTAQARFVVVDPPHGSAYSASRTPYTVQSGEVVVKLAAPAVGSTAVPKP